MSKIRVNYKSDLPPIEVKFKINGEDVNVPDHDFSIRFFVDGMSGVGFECGYKNGEFINCEKTAADILTCYIDNHGFGCGRLCCEYIDLAKNKKYSDGIRKTVTPNCLDIILVEGEGDDIVSITSSVVIDIAALIADVEAALQEMEGFADIIAALQSAVATIPNVVDNLVTGGHTDALSAEQGKRLKALVDELGRISIDGIKGFVPISSLGELPSNPTTEQKRQAYLFENALNVYVGVGGDTLDGKYQSVELVNLDWGDKSYNTSEFSGLGRRWLKKNVVDDKNVLTSAMIGTANTEYFIQYDYDLNGATVTLPANASLVFMGGSIKNGTLIGNNTRIQAKKGVCIFDGITIQGTWDVAEAYSSWFKMHKKGYKIKSVTENGTTIGSTSYATFRVEGYNADSTIDYVAAPSSVAGTFDASGYSQYDDTAALQSLLDLRAKRTIIEDGIYMVNADANSYAIGSTTVRTALYYDAQESSELTINGWIKLHPNNYTHSRVLDVVGCKNIRINGKGGIQGDLLEHTGSSGEWSHVFTISNTTGMTVEGLTFAYAWGDCVYNHWLQNWRIASTVGDEQEFHTYKNLRILYGGRTGYSSEHGDNVVVDGCYFNGSGRVRRLGVGTWSAVDIEPFGEDEISQRYVINYEFRNNVFENSFNGLRLERCVNCSVHDNYFDFGSTGILVARHGDMNYDITSPSDRGWVKSRMSIYNNNIKRCSKGIVLGAVTDVQNIEVSGNTLVSCPNPILSGESPNPPSGERIYRVLTNCKIFNNTTYGCGTWYFEILKDCDIYGNKSYAVKMDVYLPSGGRRALRILNFNACSGSKYHNNEFSLDYGVSFYGLGAYGKEEIYHGLPAGYRQSAFEGVSLTQPQKIHFYENHVSDDFYVLYKLDYDYQGNNNFVGGINSIRNENSETFVYGDTFRSISYGDEGVVIKGGMTSCSWLKTEAEGGIVREFEPNMEVSYGEIIKVENTFRVCSKAGTCGDTFRSGDAEFLSDDATAYSPGSAVANRIKIAFKTRGLCTSETRPDSFLYAGRRMWETDTNKEIVYDGSDWVYNDIYTEQ